MKKAVSFRRNSSGAIDDRLAQAPGRVEGRNFQDLTSIHIDVSGGVGLQSLGRTFDGDAGLPARDCQHRFAPNRHGVPDVDVLRKSAEALRDNLKAIRVGRNIHQLERAVRPRLHALVVPRQHIAEVHLSAGNCRAGWIDDRSFDRSRVTERLCKRPICEAESKYAQSADSKKSLHFVSITDESTGDLGYSHRRTDTYDERTIYRDGRIARKVGLTVQDLSNVLSLTLAYDELQGVA